MNKAVYGGKVLMTDSKQDLDFLELGIVFLSPGYRAESGAGTRSIGSGRTRNMPST